MQLDKWERLKFVNQFQTLALLTNDNDLKSYYKNCAEIYERGYAGQYGYALEAINGWAELSESECAYVEDVLRMYSAIFTAKRDGTKLPDNNAFVLSFTGFDGNNEAHYLAYASFLIRKLKRQIFLDKEDLNSHCPTGHLYRPMLSAWKQSAAPYELTDVDLERIVLSIPSSQSN